VVRPGGDDIEPPLRLNGECRKAVFKLQEDQPRAERPQTPQTPQTPQAQIRFPRRAPRFRDRTHAGQELAAELQHILDPHEAIILAIPPDGVPVAASAASSLNVPLDLVIPGRIVAPGTTDSTLAVVTPDRTLLVNRSLVSRMGLSDEDVERLSIPAWAEVQRAQQAYRRGRPYPDLRGRTVVIVDESLSTGYTMIAAAVSVRKMEPARIVVAVPVCHVEGAERVRAYADELLSLEMSNEGDFVGASYYLHLPPLTEREIIWILDHFWAEHPPQGYSETF
jgi:predicted phosphoribosyltransferase